MRLTEKIFANAIFSLHVLLVFFLLAGERLSLPAWMQVIGRSHPLVLHLPIGILVMVGLIWLFRKRFHGQDVENMVRLTLYILSFTAVITALAGFILSQEGGYDEVPLRWHLYTGVITSFLCWALLLVFVHLNSNQVTFTSLVWTSLASLVVAGHFGGSLTHGEGYLLQPWAAAGDEAVPVTDSTSLYDTSVRMVLRSKCYGCHNEKKRKGELVMTSVKLFSSGGENGSPWKPGDPDNSLIVKRMLLPEEDDDHMPPSGKTQLTEEEKKLIHLWIAGGPDFSTPWTKFPHDDSLYLLTRTFVERHAPGSGSRYTFEFAPDETVRELNTPYRTVTRIAESEPALRAEFFSAQAFRGGEVQELSPVREQLVDLSVNRMPLTADDMNAIRSMKELERLNMNNTGIKGADLIQLLQLGKLHSVSLVGNQLSYEDVRKLGAIRALRDVKLWGTPLTADEVARLQSEFPEVYWDMGYVPDEGERLKLTPPVLANEDLVLSAGERVELKSNFPGVNIRYSLDGTEPDSVTSAVYSSPFAIAKHTRVQAIVCKEGWYCSEPAEYYLFIEGQRPDSANLLTLPDKDYRAEGALTLIDGKKGSPSNYRDGAWVAYRQQPLEALFAVGENSRVRSITVSFAVNIPSYLMPPSSVELWGGGGPSNLSRLMVMRPAQPTTSGFARIETVTLPLDGAQQRWYKLVINQVARLPAWHPGKGQRGWVFVDEVFFDRSSLE